MRRMWIDANVILRFLTGEPQHLHERSARLMARADQGDIELFVDDLIVAETVWVLKSFYKRSMADIADVLTAFLTAPGIAVADQALLIRSLQLSERENVDFVDALLALRAAAQDAEICTFDKTDFRRLPVRWNSPA